MKKHQIETYLGLKIDLFKPKPKQIDIRDIARGLAMTVRFGGHLDNFMSVAQHSYNVSKILESFGQPPKVQMYGLLHDASEAYLGDIVHPLKYMLPSYRKLEKNMMKVLLKGLRLKLNLTRKQLKYVKMADDNILVIERFDLKQKCCKKNGWGSFITYSGITTGPKEHDKLNCLDWAAAEKQFLNHYKKLKTEIK